MIPQANSRLAIAAVFLSFLLVIFAFELGVITRSPASSTPTTPTPAEKKRRKQLIRLRHFVAPMSIGLLGAILIPIVFTGKGTERVGTARVEQCDAEVDADIGGDGIRIAVWVQESVLLLIALLGTFHCSATGAKEIGAGLALTHISLAIALLVQLGRGTLTSADAILGSIILDSQSSALSVQLVAKETLASRWQVVIIVLCQLLGLVAIPVLVDDFRNGKFATEGCSCIAVFWWGWLSDCSAFPSREMAVFWTYYACRCVACLQCCYNTLGNTIKFHDAEKHGMRLKGITYPIMADSEAVPGIAGQAQRGTPEGSKYSDYPATVSLMYTIYGLFALTSMASAEIAMRDYGLHPSSQVFSVGQIIAVVVASATIVRGFYLFFMMLLEGGEGFTWPFLLEVAKEVAGFSHRDRGTYVVLPIKDDERELRFPKFGDTPDQSLRLGSIIRSPSSLYQPLMVAESHCLEVGVTSFPRDDLPIDVSYGQSHTVRFPGVARLFGDPLKQNYAMIWDRKRTLSIKRSEDQETYFQPTPEYLAKCVQDSSVRKALRWGQAYMITGLRIGNDIRLKEHKESSHYVKFNMEGLGGPGLAGSIGREEAEGHETQYEGRVIFAYQLSVLRKSWFSEWVEHEVLVPEPGALAFS